ncbi:MAG: hypothetical protein ABSA75_11490 [Candidatus Bathyarchaeia archaeon]|jgi:hypothetical protein
MENLEFNKTLCRSFAEIAEKEKNKAINAEDYGAALVATIIEGIFKQALLNLDLKL